MAIGTTAAIIMAGGAALSAYGAHKQASGAKEAAKTQVGAAETAKADLRPLYEQSVARMDPYAQLGGQAVGQLRALGGYPAPPPLPPGGSAAAPQWPNLAQGAVGLAARFAPNGSLAKPQGGGVSMATLGNPTAGRTASSYGGPPTGTAVPRQGGSFQTTQGGLVMMQAPDGEQREVPLQLVPQLEQAGARRIG